MHWLTVIQCYYGEPRATITGRRCQENSTNIRLFLIEPAASHPVPVIKVAFFFLTTHNLSVLLVIHKHVFKGVESLIKVVEVGGRNVYKNSVLCVIFCHGPSVSLNDVGMTWSSSVVGGRGDRSSVACPVGVDELTRVWQQLVCVRSEIVPLCLKHKSTTVTRQKKLTLSNWYLIICEALEPDTHTLPCVNYKCLLLSHLEQVSW